MDLRPATREDLDDIRTVAAASLAASYDSLDESLRDRAVESWYGEAGLAADLTEDDAVVVVAVDDGDVVGFVQSYLVERPGPAGRIDWLHVHPDYRGQGLGGQLLHRAEADLADRGAERFEGRVLTANETGEAFYEGNGYERSGRRTLELDDDELEELTFIKYRDETAAPSLVESRETDDDETVYVAFDESDRGSVAPLYVTYADPDREERFGWFCGNCEGLEINMDAMGRVECSNCENRRKPTRWDATYGG